MGEPAALTPPSLPSASTRLYSFGSFEVDVPRCQLRRDGKTVALAPKAFDLLLVLIRHRDRVIPKEELLKAVWPNAFVSEDNLSSTIWVLRRALGDDSNQATFITTVPRRGYRFIASVTETSTDDSGPTDTAVVARGFDTPAVAIPPAAVVKGMPASPVFRSPVLVAAVFLGLILGAFITTFLGRASAPSPLAIPGRFTLEAPEGTVLASGAVVSPNGRAMAFIAQDGSTGETRLWVKALDATAPRVIDGTSRAVRPFWSPDSTALGFFAAGSLKVVPVTDGSPRILAQNIGPTPLGGSWGAGGAIVFSAGGSGSALLSVPATGGAAKPATVIDANGREVSHQWPSFLPDGRRFLFVVTSRDPQRAGLYVGSIDSSERVQVVAGLTSPTIFAAPGYLLSAAGGELRAQAFDPSATRVEGAPIAVVSEAFGPGALQSHSLSASSNGTVTFGGGMVPGRVAWFDRQGRTLGEVTTGLFNMETSPDGRQVLASGPFSVGGTGVWLLDAERGVTTQIVADGNLPVWGPGGDRIAFTASRRQGDETIYTRSISSGAVEDRPVYTQRIRMWLDDWTSDGRYLIFTNTDQRTRQDLWLLRADSGLAKPLLQTPANEHQAQVSPDGRSIAYASDESGQWNVYVDVFPTLGAKRAISTSGGAQPQWSADGRSLYYLRADRQLMVVSVDRQSDWAIGRSESLFPVPVRLDGFSDQRSFYTVSPKGDRFLVERARRTPATILLNWPKFLEKP